MEVVVELIIEVQAGELQHMIYFYVIKIIMKKNAKTLKKIKEVRNDYEQDVGSLNKRKRTSYNIKQQRHLVVSDYYQ